MMWTEAGGQQPRRELKIIESDVTSWGIAVSDFKQTETESRGCLPDVNACVGERSEPLRDERDYLSAGLGILSGVVLVADVRGLIVWANKPAHEVSGDPPAELCGRFIWDLAKPVERETVRRYFEQALSSSRHLDIEHRPTDDQARAGQASQDRAVVLAHDLSQPLEVIATYAQAGLLQLRKKPLDADRVIDSFEKIVLQIQFAAEILRDVREVR